MRASGEARPGSTGCRRLSLRWREVRWREMALPRARRSSSLTLGRCTSTPGGLPTSASIGASLSPSRIHALCMGVCVCVCVCVCVFPSLSLSPSLSHTSLCLCMIHVCVYYTSIHHVNYPRTKKHICILHTHPIFHSQQKYLLKRAECRELTRVDVWAAQGADTCRRMGGDASRRARCLPPVDPRRSPCALERRVRARRRRARQAGSPSLHL